MKATYCFALVNHFFCTLCMQYLGNNTNLPDIVIDGGNTITLSGSDNK